MAIMLPPSFDNNDPRRNGERLVFNWLSNTALPGYAFYSVLQKNHKFKIMGEIDFLYICSRGLLCIEVKGGKDIYRKERKWYSLSKNNKEYEISNPFLQAQDCMFALKKYLKMSFVRDKNLSNPLIGFGVIFPECKFTGHGNDLLTEVLFDNNNSLFDFGNYLNAAFDYWKNEEYNKHGNISNALTAEQIEKIAVFLRGDFKVIPSMNLEMQHIQQQIIELTDEQCSALDNTKYNPRIIIQGGAGTGKSILAMEKLRQNQSQKINTLYLCYNRNMAKYAEMSFNNKFDNNCHIYTFYSLIGKYFPSTDIHTKSLEEISKMFLEDIPFDIIEKYDYLIIDEAQDIINTLSMTVFEKILLGGMKNGKWILFLDPNQNIFNKNDDFEFTMKYLDEMCKPSYYVLNYNCRNTDQIARRTSVISLVPPSKFMKIRGPNVIIKTYTDNDKLRSLLRKELLSLFSGGTSSSDIVILSKYKYANSGIINIKPVNNMEIIENDDIKQIRKGQINYFTVQSFKGLESNIVFLIDIDGFKGISNRSINYVALSRAKVLLYVFYPETLKAEYQEVAEKGVDLL